MIKKIILTTLTVSGFFFGASAQTTDGPTTPKEKAKYNYYLGLQCNDLLRQLLPFNNNVALTGNPYLFTFQMHNQKSGWGLRSGFNYELKNLVDEDAANRKNTVKNIFYAKVGIEKFVKLSNRFAFAYGLDGTWEYGQNFTKNTLSSIDTTISTTNNRNNVLGVGPSVRIMYNLSSRVLIGTDAGLYFSKNNNKTAFTIKTISQFNGNSDSYSETKNTNSEFLFQKPIALYLIVKLNK